MPRGIPSAVCPGSTLSDSLGSAQGELNTCRGICWGLASCAGNCWTTHKLNMVSQGLHFTPSPKCCCGSLGGSCSSQPWVLLIPTNLCVPLSSLPCCQLVSSNPSGICQGLRKWQKHWGRLIHCMSEIQATKILCLRCLLFLFLWHPLAIPDIWPVKHMKTNKK